MPSVLTLFGVFCCCRSFVVVVLGIKPQLGKHSTDELHPSLGLQFSMISNHRELPETWFETLFFIELLAFLKT
jgi:hypothetical protein